MSSRQELCSQISEQLELLAEVAISVQRSVCFLSCQRAKPGSPGWLNAKQLQVSVEEEPVSETVSLDLLIALGLRADETADPLIASDESIHRSIHP